jgi:hypothetical protein
MKLQRLRITLAEATRSVRLELDAAIEALETRQVRDILKRVTQHPAFVAGALVAMARAYEVDLENDEVLTVHADGKRAQHERAEYLRMPIDVLKLDAFKVIGPDDMPVPLEVDHMHSAMRVGWQNAAIFLRTHASILTRYPSMRAVVERLSEFLDRTRELADGQRGKQGAESVATIVHRALAETEIERVFDAWIAERDLKTKRAAWLDAATHLLGSSAVFREPLLDEEVESAGNVWMAMARRAAFELNAEVKRRDAFAEAITGINPRDSFEAGVPRRAYEAPSVKRVHASEVRVSVGGVECDGPVLTDEQGRPLPDPTSKGSN